MAVLSSQTIVTTADALAVTQSFDFTILPNITGSLSLRELLYPTTTFAPITYQKNPDTWTNFDVAPLTKRPVVVKQATLEDNRITQWIGYDRDADITETWRGSDSEAPMSLTFFRQLYAYYENPPVVGFIQWLPKDRTVNTYNIVIKSLTVGGQDVTYNFIAALQDCLTGDVVMKFEIVSQV